MFHKQPLVGLPMHICSHYESESSEKQILIVRPMVLTAKILENLSTDKESPIVKNILDTFETYIDIEQHGSKELSPAG